MKTKDICRQLGITVKALRVYEAAGLCSAVRKDNNYREYNEEDVIKIKSIQLLRTIGFPLKDIKKIMEDVEEKRDLLQLFYMQLKGIEAQLESLEKTKKTLTDNINYILSADFHVNKLAEELVRSPAVSSRETIAQTLLKQWDFDSMAVGYIERYLIEDDNYLQSTEKAENLISQYDKEAKIIDIGGGPGTLWEQMPEYGNVTILDNSLGMLLEAQRKVPWAKFILNDILEVDQYHYDKYDLVIATFLLHHIEYEKQMDAISNMLSLCKGSGTVIVVDRCFDNRQKKEQYLKWCEESGNLRLKSEIEEECWLLGDNIIYELTHLGYNVKATVMSELVWCLEIRKEAKR